jgi:16S rRNA (adenine1518-N6/adenine1519-N6)-dimethyltransferase
MKVRAKKHLGQHFLRDMDIAHRIVESLTMHKSYKTVLEIGPGMGVLTQFLLQNTNYQTHVVEIDRESVAYLKINYPMLEGRILEGDFLRYNLDGLFGEPFGIIGNFPYNISSQIFFKVLENRDQVLEIVCMLQKEVAQRIASPPGNKDYGILSVLMQAFYKIDYCFTVEAISFDPPPKVRSGVIRMRRNEVERLDCDEKKFIQLVKTAFNQRRKTLRNALKPLGFTADSPLLDLRAERLGVAEFVTLTQLWEQQPTEN